MNIKKVKLEKGYVTLEKPKAGLRNEAYSIADTPQGLKKMVFLMELLPLCIIEHPFQIYAQSEAQKKEILKQSLEELEMEEYDLLVEALGELIKPPTEEIEKKLEEPSSQKDSHQKGGSEQNL